MIPPALLVALALLLAAPQQQAPADDAPRSAPPSAEQDASAAVGAADEQPLPRLEPGEVARIEPDLSLTDADFDRYLGTVYARKPTGDEALHQLLCEALILEASAKAGITVDEADVTSALEALEQRAREATDGKLGVAESLGAGVSQDDLRTAVRLLVLHERVLRAERGITPDEPVDPSELQGWLDAAVADAQFETKPLEDPLAATWRGGAISKAAVGSRLRRMLAPQDVSGVLTEMIGVLLVRREAARRDISLTPADATEEVLQRNAALHNTPGASSVTYVQYLDQIEHRTLEELLRSEKFATEVLLRKISEQDWSEDDARKVWEDNQSAFEAAGLTGTWQDVRATVWRQLRQRSYTTIFRESRIARRF